MKSKAAIWVVSTAAVLLAIGLLCPNPWTGRRSVRKIDSLNNPVEVKGWKREGIVLVDGRSLQLPGFLSLPDHSVALTAAIKRGIEIAPDGKLYGLMRIHHWCGNDPVREQLARVNISDVMMFLHVGQPASPIPEADSTARENEAMFTEWGWNVSEFGQFKAWEEFKDANL